MILRDMKKERTVKGRMKLKVQKAGAAKMAPLMKERAMSMMGDPSSDDE